MRPPIPHRYLRAYGLMRYRDALKHLDAGEVRELRGEDLSALGVRDVADKAKLARMIKEMRRDANRRRESTTTTTTTTTMATSSVVLQSVVDDGQTSREDQRVGSSSPSSSSSDEEGEAIGDADPPPIAFASTSKIRVSVRKRPLNAKEKSRGERDICQTAASSSEEENVGGGLTVWEHKTKVDLTRFVEKHAFAFDNVFDESASNDEVYANEVKPLVDFVIGRRGNATCFAYGQTGSGKTYTMQPLPGRAARDILTFAASAGDSGRGDASPALQLWVSAFEIYGGRVFDLLNGRRKLRVLEDSKSQICVVGLQEYRVDASETFDRLVEHSTKARCVGSTGANAESSRSHAILQLVLKRPCRRASSASFAVSPDDQPSAEAIGKLSFIDLAGSERGADTTDNDRQTRIEGAEINKSLLALKECIRALDSGASHVPFRGSKLTEVLRDSFLGDSRTVMIANISPAEGSCEHTLNTLRYADRVKELTREGSVDAPTNSGASGTSVVSNGSRIIAGSVASKDPKTTAFEPRVSPSSTLRAPRGARHSSSAHEISRTRHKLSRGRESTPNVHSDDSLMKPLKSYSAREREDMTPEEAVRAHDELIDVILCEEDGIIAAHRAHIERSMEVVKQEMEFLARVEQPGSAVDAYVDGLDAILAERAQDVAHLRDRVNKFRCLLQREEALSARVLSTQTAST